MLDKKKKPFSFVLFSLNRTFAQKSNKYEEVYWDYSCPLCI